MKLHMACLASTSCDQTINVMGKKKEIKERIQHSAFNWWSWLNTLTVSLCWATSCSPLAAAGEAAATNIILCFKPNILSLLRDWEDIFEISLIGGKWDLSLISEEMFSEGATISFGHQILELRLFGCLTLMRCYKANLPTLEAPGVHTGVCFCSTNYYYTQSDHFIIVVYRKTVLVSEGRGYNDAIEILGSTKEQQPQIIKDLVFGFSHPHAIIGTWDSFSVLPDTSTVFRNLQMQEK